MEKFSALYRELDQTTSTNAKVDAMVRYFERAEPADVAWATWFLSGRRLKRLVGASLLREWLTAESELPAWLVEDTYSNVGDLAETIALLLANDAQGGAGFGGATLAAWVETELLPLRRLPPEAQRERVTGWWRSLDYDSCYLVNKLMTGALRVGVSQTLVASALARVADLPRPVILHRLMGDWTPDAGFAGRLLAEDDGSQALSRPYPFCLASPVEFRGDAPEHEQLESGLGEAGGWQVEWKWDGIRGQLIRRSAQTFLWSRGEELITERFPEIATAAAALPDGTVLDGELVAWRDGAVMPFSALQRRIGRKKPGAKTLATIPVIFIAYDVLEHGGTDVRALPQTGRRAALDALARDFPAALTVSALLRADDWRRYAELRQTSRDRGVEGLMLKANDAAYGTGRRKGLWWKWKVEPFTVDAVMLYAQAGHGRRSNLHTDYTFAVWRGDDLVPIAKAYSGLNNDEIDELDKWIRRNTRERFGPVRSVEPEQVFELAFEAIAPSGRHKSGVALRFPRIKRWRRDKRAGDADRLAALEALL